MRGVVESTPMTEQYQQASINLMPNAEVTQLGIGAANVPIPGAVVTPVPWNTILDESPLIRATAGSPIVEFLADGIFFAEWSVSIGVSSGGRKNSMTSFLIDTGGGFVPELEVFGFGYHRNIAAGRDTTTKQLRRTVSAGDRIEITSQRIAGTGNLQFLASSCSLIVGLVPLG